MPHIVECARQEDFEQAKVCARDYMNWLGMDLSFQDVSKEFADFAERYSPPEGLWLLARVEGEAAGGVGYRRLAPEICEMKRMYLYPRFQGLGLGKALCQELIQRASQAGYQAMRLDTLPRLTAANRLYESLGFKDIPPYYHNPEPYGALPGA